MERKSDGKRQDQEGRGDRYGVHGARAKPSAAPKIAESKSPHRLTPTLSARITQKTETTKVTTIILFRGPDMGDASRDDDPFSIKQTRGCRHDFAGNLFSKWGHHFVPCVIQFLLRLGLADSSREGPENLPLLVFIQLGV